MKNAPAVFDFALDILFDQSIIDQPSRRPSILPDSSENLRCSSGVSGRDRASADI